MDVSETRKRPANGTETGNPKKGRVLSISEACKTPHKLMQHVATTMFGHVAPACNFVTCQAICNDMLLEGNKVLFLDATPEADALSHYMGFDTFLLPEDTHCGLLEEDTPWATTATTYYGSAGATLRHYVEADMPPDPDGYVVSSKLRRPPPLHDPFARTPLNLFTMTLGAMEAMRPALAVEAVNRLRCYFTDIFIFVGMETLVPHSVLLNLFAASTVFTIGVEFFSVQGVADTLEKLKKTLPRKYRAIYMAPVMATTVSRSNTRRCQTVCRRFDEHMATYHEPRNTQMKMMFGSVWPKLVYKYNVDLDLHHGPLSDLADQLGIPPVMVKIQNVYLHYNAVVDSRFMHRVTSWNKTQNERSCNTWGFWRALYTLCVVLVCNEYTAARIASLDRHLQTLYKSKDATAMTAVSIAEYVMRVLREDRLDERICMKDVKARETQIRCITTERMTQGPK